MKATVVDTAAAVVFFTLVAGTSELLIVGLPWDAVVTARLAAAPVMVATGRPYGLWRDWVMRRGCAQAGPLRATVLDILAFISFQAPVYAAILVISGATAEQIAVAVGVAVAMMVPSSRVYGLYLDAVRRWCGVAPAGAVGR